MTKRFEPMNQARLRYAMDVVKYLRGDGKATDAMVEHITERYAGEIPYTTLNGDDSTVDEWMCDRALDYDDFGLTQNEFTEAEDELACIAEAEAYARDDDPGNIGYIARKARMEEGDK